MLDLAAHAVMPVATLAGSVRADGFGFRTAQRRAIGWLGSISDRLGLSGIRPRCCQSVLRSARPKWDPIALLPVRPAQCSA